MELIEGEDWGRKMGDPQDEADVRRILTGVLRGLAHLHAHGEIHGDLKPGNILLARGGSVKVADVGMGGGGGRPLGVAATPGYAAPEIWEGKSADERSDLYSVGVLAYEALTGRHPFGGKTIREVVTGQMKGWVPSPGALGLQISPEMERAFMRALERDPALRQATSDDWMEELGVQDRIGQILKGKFVDRAEILSCLTADGYFGDAAITLLCLHGETGIGRSSTLEQISQTVLSNGGAVVRVLLADLHSTLALAKALSAQLPDGASSIHTSLPGCHTWQELAALLHITAQEGPLILVIDGRYSSDGTLLGNLRSLGRALRARRKEKRSGTRAGVQILAAIDRELDFAEPHEQSIRLDPFDADTTASQIAGILGKAELPQALSTHLQSMTRGIPGLVFAATFELIDVGALQRRSGTWRFDEGRQIEVLALSSLSDPSLQVWRRTPESMRHLLTAVALLRSGADTEIFEGIAEGDVEGDLAYLHQLGWLRRSGNRWSVLSPHLRAFVIGAIGTDAVRTIAGSLLSRTSLGITKEDEGELLLIAGTGSHVWEAGLRSARFALERGEHRLVLERTERLLNRRDLWAPASTRACGALLRADAMNHLGMDSEAIGLLNDPELWELDGVGEEAGVRRARQLGVLYRTIGRVDDAKEWLQRAVHLAREAKDLKAYLQAIAEANQLEWEHGTEPERRGAIELIRGALAESTDARGVEDERAALTYGLGSALIWNGDRAAAKSALLEGLQAECSDYWKMRITNALCSATMALGDYEESLRWSHEAWTHAERSGTDWFRARILANRGATLHALGKLRESAESDIAAAEWGRRTGNPYEYEAGIAGAAINLLLLARYEEALVQANEAHAAAERARNERHIAKGLELRALVHFYIGELDEAQRLVRLGQSTLAKHEYVDTKPRLDWLDARIAIERGELNAARGKLEEVEAGLLKIPDLEDLWGVQVELYLTRGRIERDPAVLALLSRVVADARGAGVRLAWVTGTLAIGEIVTEFGLDDGEYRALMRDGLAMAEECGMLELSWQLAYRLGLVAMSEGDRKGSHARFTHAIRIVKEIASHLAPPHRSSYMKSRRVSAAIEAMSRQM